MQVLALSGSLREASSNTQILRILREKAPRHVQVTLFQRLGELPHYSPDIDDDGQGNGEKSDPTPESVQALRNQLKLAKGLILCTPEYAFGVPGVLKNALDWLVSSGEINGLPTLALSASPTPAGGDKAYASLRLTLTALGAAVVEPGSRSFPNMRLRLDSNGKVTDPELEKELEQSLLALVEAIELKG